jgi:hypothetical protein
VPLPHRKMNPKQKIVLHFMQEVEDTMAFFANQDAEIASFVGNKAFLTGEEFLASRPGYEELLLKLAERPTYFIDASDFNEQEQEDALEAMAISYGLSKFDVCLMLSARALLSRIIIGIMQEGINMMKEKAGLKGFEMGPLGILVSSN